MREYRCPHCGKFLLERVFGKAEMKCSRSSCKASLILYGTLQSGMLITVLDKEAVGG